MTIQINDCFSDAIAKSETIQRASTQKDRGFGWATPDIAITLRNVLPVNRTRWEFQSWLATQIDHTFGGCSFMIGGALLGNEIMLTKKQPNPVDVYVGGRVRMRRMMLGMTQEKLADAIGLTFQQVQKYEKGTNRISSSRLQQAANFLQVPVSFFFEGAPGHAETKGDGPSPSIINDFLATSDGLALTKAFTQIKSKKLRRSVVDMVQEIAGPET